MGADGCSQKHCDYEYGTDFSWEQFAVEYLRQQCRSQLCCNGLTLPETLEQIPPCQREMELVRGHGTLRRKTHWC